MGATWTWPAVVRRRLDRNHLRHPAPPGGAVDVVAPVCGVQAQVVVAAEIGRASCRERV